MHLHNQETVFTYNSLIWFLACADFAMNYETMWNMKYKEKRWWFSTSLCLAIHLVMMYWKKKVAVVMWEERLQYKSTWKMPKTLGSIIICQEFLLTRYLSVSTLQGMKVVHKFPHWYFKGFKQPHVFKKPVWYLKVKIIKNHAAK